VQLIKLAFPYRSLAARATRVPLVGHLVDRWLFDGDHLIYLPKDQLLPIDESIDLPGEVVLPSQVVEHFVTQAGTHWIMDRCLCRDASHCEDYPIDLGCLFLGEAAAGINPKLGRPVSAQEALEHVRRCREVGLVHMIGRNKLDLMWLGTGPGDRLLTICNCCPCCCLWGMLPHLAPEIGAKVNRMQGVSVHVGDACIGCGSCAEDICFAGAIRVVSGRAMIDDTCKGCGRCVEVCPEGAIELAVEHEGFVQESISRLSSLVDVS
jgi:ferredoxin